MGTGWKKIVGMAMVAGAIGAMALGAVAFAQSPTPTTPSQNNNTAPTQNNAPFGWFGHGPMGGPGAMGFGGRGFGMGPQGFGAEMRGDASFIDAAAKAFNLTVQDLFTQLQSGKTLADIAKEKNVDTTKLVSDYVATFSDSLKTAVTNNQLTQAQADARLAEIKADAEALLNQKFNANAFGQPGFGNFGPGFRGGRGGGFGRGFGPFQQQPQQQQQVAPQGTQQSY